MGELRRWAGVTRGCAELEGGGDARLRGGEAGEEGPARGREDASWRGGLWRGDAGEKENGKGDRR